MALLERGADIEAKNNDDKTPLHEATLYNYETLALSLIEKGANVNAMDNTGATPLDYCQTEVISTHSLNTSMRAPKRREYMIIEFLYMIITCAL